MIKPYFANDGVTIFQGDALANVYGRTATGKSYTPLSLKLHKYERQRETIQCN